MYLSLYRDVSEPPKTEALVYESALRNELLGERITEIPVSSTIYNKLNVVLVRTSVVVCVIVKVFSLFISLSFH